MHPKIISFDPSQEYFFKEGCYINELSNLSTDPDVSIAQARVEPGVTTQWHRLESTTERYVILEGQGRAEVEGLEPTEVTAGDVVIIPAMQWQRITNIGNQDLVFLAICSPRFEPEAYQENPSDSTEI